MASTQAVRGVLENVVIISINFNKEQPHLNKLSQNYEYTLCVATHSKDEAQKWKAANLSPSLFKWTESAIANYKPKDVKVGDARLSKDGKKQYIVNFKTYANNEKGERNNPPPIVDNDLNPIDPTLVGWDSIVDVAYMVKPAEKSPGKFSRFVNGVQCTYIHTPKRALPFKAKSKPTEYSSGKGSTSASKVDDLDDDDGIGSSKAADTPAPNVDDIDLDTLPDIDADIPF